MVKYQSMETLKPDGCPLNLTTAILASMSNSNGDERDGGLQT